MEQVFHDIGLAVLEVQMFEMTLTPVYQLFKIAVEPAHYEKHRGYIPEGAWKQALTNLVAELEAKQRIAPELAERLRSFAVQRHTLVHRWVTQNGWPGDNLGAEEYASLASLARAVKEEAIALRVLIAARALLANGRGSPGKPEDMFAIGSELSEAERRALQEIGRQLTAPMPPGVVRQPPIGGIPVVNPYSRPTEPPTTA